MPSISRKLLDYMPVVILLIYSWFLFWKPIEIEDIWWHLRLGEWMLAHGQVPREDPFSFVDPKTPWIWTQWLGSLFYYGIYKISGLTGLQLFRAVFFLGVLGFIGKMGSRKLPSETLLFILFLLALSLETRALLRPDALNNLFIPIFLWLLWDFYHNPGSQKVWLLLPIGILWHNINLGSFIYGAGLMGAFCFAAVLERRREAVRFLMALLVVYFVSFLINPYGWQGAVFPWGFFLNSNSTAFYQVKSSIVETNPPNYLLTIEGLWFWGLFFLAGFCIHQSQTSQKLKAVLFIFALGSFLLFARCSSFFAIVAAFLIIQSYPEIADRWKKKIQRYETVLMIILCCVFVAGIALAVTNKVYAAGQWRNYRNLALTPVNPQRAIDVLQKNQITGPVFTTTGFGSYLVWNGFPQLKPMVDTRHVNKEVFDWYLAALTNPEKIWPALDEKFNFQVVMLDASKDPYLNAVAFFSQHKGWQIVFMEGACVVFVKRNSFTLPPELASFENNLNASPISTDEIAVLSAWEHAHQPPIFFRPGYNETLQEAGTFVILGYDQSAYEKLTKALDVRYDHSTQTTLKKFIRYFQSRTSKRERHRLL